MNHSKKINLHVKIFDSMKNVNDENHEYFLRYCNYSLKNYYFDYYYYYSYLWIFL